MTDHLMQNKRSQPPSHLTFINSVIVKAGGLFIILNILFAITYPLPALGKLSIYNHLIPGRERLPYSDTPQKSYNLSLFNLEAMFASHEINARPKPTHEYRVIIIGDSSTWGFLLTSEDTLSAQLNQIGLFSPDGRQMRFYNLGYPVMSLTKDLLILSYAMHFQPDLIIWPITLESMPDDKQLFPPILQHNSGTVRTLIHDYQLSLDPQSPELLDLSPWDRTIIGARRPLADLLRLQLYGLMWAATGIDQDIPQTYTPRMEDLPADESFHNLAPPHLQETDLAIDILLAGLEMAGDTPLLLVNEPMFISQGENSHIRYNFFYPRWAYDDYRQIMSTLAARYQWHYIDLWDTIPGSEFTNSAVHLTPKGTHLFAQQVADTIRNLVEQTSTQP